MSRGVRTERLLDEQQALAMLADAHNTNVAENREFFLNANNPANFQRTFETAYFLYRKVGSLSGNPVPFDQVLQDIETARALLDHAMKRALGRFSIARSERTSPALRA